MREKKFYLQDVVYGYILDWCHYVRILSLVLFAVTFVYFYVFLKLQLGVCFHVVTVYCVLLLVTLLLVSVCEQLFSLRP